MNGDGLDALARRERAALRQILVATAVRAGRAGDPADLERLVAVSPMHALPPAATMHRIPGTVLRGLDGVEGVPGAVSARLAELRDLSARRHLLFTAALGEIGQRFDADSLSWVAMKGPLTATRYPGVGDRTYADLDIVVDRRHFPGAMRLLEELGYEHANHDWALAERKLAGELTMWKQSVQLDVHWHLHYSRQDRRSIAVEPEAMIERRVPVTVSGLTTWALDDVDTLLTLAFHAARSDGHRLVWLKDIERQVATAPPDYDELVRRCRRYRCAPPVGLLLGRARRVIDAEVPDEVVAALVPRSLRAAERAVCALVPPIQLHERSTPTRAFTRSIRASLAASAAVLPARALRWVQRSLVSPPANETDDEDEKASYLRAVVASMPR